MSSAAAAQQTPIQRLLAAKRAYFSSGDSGLTDAEYDQLEAAVIRESPEAAAVVDATGWTPSASDGAVQLPFLMPSLDKGKPGEDLLTKFLSANKAVVMSEKLDGISALWDTATGRLYNRGDGVMGTDLTSFVPFIKGLQRPAAAAGELLVRGEIMLRKADANPDTPSRSQVNGFLHRAAGEADLPLRFVAYQVCGSGSGSGSAAAARLLQFKQLASAGFELPHWQVLRDPTVDQLAALLQERKAASPYDIDGLVLGNALAMPAAPEKRNGVAVKPKDCIAFKMPLSEQQARTRIVAVEWNCTRFNVYAPRIQVEPVRIGGALITYVTGHNAKFMVENGLGVGAEVTVLRSGDVIPIIYRVHTPVEPELPSDEWDATHTNVLATEESAEQKARHLENALAVLGVDGAGPAAAQALVDAKLTNIQGLLEMPAGTLAAILGPGKGPQLRERLRVTVSAAPIQTLILASSYVPKGLGKAKLTKLLETYPNCDMWAAGGRPPAAWSAATWEEFCGLWPAIRKEIEGWRATVGVKGLPAAASANANGRNISIGGAASIGVHAAAAAGGICMSGFRDAALAAASCTAGYTIDDSVKKTTHFLIVQDREDPDTISTVKAVRAREIGARIMRASDWKTYLENK
jgi:DNA ligase (NAD+)